MGGVAHTPGAIRWLSFAVIFFHSPAGVPGLLGASGQLPPSMTKLQTMPQASPGFSFPGPSHAPPPVTAAQPDFSTVNLEDLSGLGVSQRVQPSESEAETSIADAILHLHFEGGDGGAMELSGILDDAPYTSLEGINTAEFRQLLTEGNIPTSLPDNQGTLLTYPESITRLVSQRRAEGEASDGSGGGGGGNSASSFVNGILGAYPGEDSFSIVDLDLNSLLNQLNS